EAARRAALEHSGRAGSARRSAGPAGRGAGRAPKAGGGRAGTMSHGEEDLGTAPGARDGVPPGEELCELTATEMVALLRKGEIGPAELVEAHLRRIERVNGEVNAIVTLVPERALQEARAADEDRARGGWRGPLHGLPVAHKDLIDTAGIRTTYGSRVYADHVPGQDSPLVRRMRAAGAITIGKTNTPEFGTGSHTVNAVFGATRNPYDLSRSAGGSSGGAAAALATGMVPLADGTDVGGSLRNPASFCNVFGLRPTPGRT